MTYSGEAVFDVRERGAAGDGRTLDTSAIQRAVDECAASGGGMVYVPPGDYLVGSVELKSNVNLHLEAGSRLLASTRREDYRQLDLGVGEASLNYNSEHLVFARGAENVVLSGMGTIDGQGREFFGPVPEDSFHHSLKGWRPFQLAAFVECTNLLIENVTFRDAPGWTVWPLGCETVRIAGVKIFNNRWGPNTDGIDPDCCRNVTISDCVIDCGDDCIAVKSSLDKLGRREGVACEDLTVTNCVFSTSCCGIRLGYEGDAPIRNCAFSNIVMRNTRTGLNVLVPRHVDGGLDIRHGPAVENISFSNMVMDTVIPFFLWTGDDAGRPGGVRGISFSDIRATAVRGSYFGGSRSLPLENVSLRGVELTVSGEMDDGFGEEVPYPYRVWGYLTKAGPNSKRGIPHALYFRDAKEVSLSDVRVRWRGVSGLWRSALRCERVEGLDVRGGVLDGAPGDVRAPAVHLTAVRGAALRDCRPGRDGAEFLRADGESSEISAAGCEAP
ncbi:MAG: glycoside hydrolase family 28 protein [Planctomycetota bacterium]|jgi:hypothetical protein